MSGIGIMDPAFFVGKNVLLAWLNDFFQAGYTKVEQMSTGAMACQIMDAIYPGKVPLGKVNFDARTQPECVANFKVLQGVFDKESISKYIDVPKLLNGKFQDNLEFLQWLKSYFDKTYGGQEYNALERREWARASFKKVHKFAGSSKVAAPAAPPRAAAPKVSAAPAAKPTPAARPAAAAAPSVAKAAAPAAVSAAAAAEIEELRMSLQEMEKERGFYFDKLREVEILCQDESQADIAAFKKAVLDILYQTDDAAEFAAPADGDAEADAGAVAGGGGEGLLDDNELAETF